MSDGMNWGSTRHGTKTSEIIKLNLVKFLYFCKNN